MPRTELARVTCGGVTIPANAAAIAGIFTVVNQLNNFGYGNVYPTGGAVPKAGGAPGGGSPGVDDDSFCFRGDCCGLQETTAAPRRPSEVRLRNRLRDLNMNPPLTLPFPARRGLDEGLGSLDSAVTPSPQPSPLRGEGAHRLRRMM